MGRLQNLKPTIITEFKEGDTIYIQIEESRDFPITYLCEFIKYQGNRVYGKAISTETNPHLHQSAINSGLFINARLKKCALFGKDPVSGRKHYHWFMPTGYAIYPNEYNKASENAEIIKEHPSFGIIGISRIQTRNAVLFGTSILHNETMLLRIQQAEVDRDLHRERYYAKRPLIEIEFSPSQFAEFITTPNQGSGVPCTIRHIGADTIPDPPYESKTQLFTTEFKSKMENISSDLKGNIEILETILNKKSIGKNDRREILNLFESFQSDIASNVPFIAEQFNEQMDSSVKEAKGEIESFINRRISEEGRLKLFGEKGQQSFIGEAEGEEHDQAGD